MKRPLKDVRPVGPFAQRGSDTLVMYDRNVSPLVVLRDFHEDINNDVGERKYVANWGTFSYNLTSFGTISAELGFHESQVENTFEFRPATRGGMSKQGSDVEDMGGKPAEFAKLMEQAYPNAVEFNFAELDAASQGQMYLTDYEFEYELLMEKSDVTNVNIEEKL